MDDIKPINDRIFKAIFTNQKNYDLLVRLIKEATDLDVEIISVRIPELTNDNITIKLKSLDLLVRCKNEEINIELNTYSNIGLRKRNASYIFKRYSDYTKIGNSYYNMLNFIQINLNSYSKNSPIISKYSLYDNEHKKNFIDNLSIYEINLIKFKEKYYNDSEPSVIAMMDMSTDEMDKVHGDDMMEKLKDEFMQLYTAEAMRLMPPEEEEKMFIETIKDEGKIEGKLEEKINIAKNMIKENISVETIIKVTGLTKEEIDKL